MLDPNDQLMMKTAGEKVGTFPIFDKPGSKEHNIRTSHCGIYGNHVASNSISRYRIDITSRGVIILKNLRDMEYAWDLLVPFGIHREEHFAKISIPRRHPTTRGGAD